MAIEGPFAHEEDLTSISGVGPKVQGRLKDGGYTSIEALRKADQQELAAVDGISNALAARIKANIGESKLGDLFGSPAVERGDIVRDKEVERLIGVVLTDPYGRADDVMAGNKLVSEYSKNQKYDDDAEVVDVLLQEDWDKDAILKGDFTIFTYPVPRLQVLDVHIEEAEVRGQINKVKVVGTCVNCETTMTTEDDKYIEGADGRLYCSIACHNEEVT